MSEIWDDISGAVDSLGNDIDGAVDSLGNDIDGAVDSLLGSGNAPAEPSDVGTTESSSGDLSTDQAGAVYQAGQEDPAQDQQAGYADSDAVYAAPAEYQEDPAQAQQPDTDTGTSDQTDPAGISDPNGIPYGY
jgi:hypothetical protein